MPQKSFLSLLFFFIGYFSLLNAQNLGLRDTICPNTNVFLNTPVVNSPQYYWDMCANNDLLNTPSVELLKNNLKNSNRSEGICTVWDNVNNKWYGFVTNREGGANANTLLRLDFGDDLRNLPVEKSLGNINNVFSSPKGIKFIKANGIWYGFIVNRTSKKIARLKFPNGLASDTISTSFVSIPAWTSTNSAFLDVVYDAPNNRYIIVQIDFANAIQILDFGTNIESTPTILRHVNPPVLNNNNLPIQNIFGISLLNYMGNWYGLTHGGGGIDQKIHLINFKTNLTASNAPDIKLLDYTTTFPLNNNPIESWQACQLMQDGVNLVGFIISNFGTLTRINFRTNPLGNPIYTRLGDFGVFSKPLESPRATTANSSLNFSIIDSQWVGFTINRTPSDRNVLFRIIFPNVCDATPKFTNVANPSVSFSTPGKKFITHTAYNSDRNPISSNYMYMDSTIVKDAVVAEFQALEKCLGEATVFNNISQGNLSQASSWSWDFGNGQTSTLQNPTFTYTQAGNYLVKLKVINFSGCENTFTQLIRISNYPVANFKVKQMNCSNGTVDFEDISTIPNADIALGGQIVNRFWNFGDGTTYLTAPINLTNLRKGNVNAPVQGSTPFLANNSPYLTNDRYIVGLAVTDDAGCVSSSYRTISFKPEDIPTPDFTIGTACVGNFVNFTDQSTPSSTNFAPPTKWKWRIFNASNQKIDSAIIQNPFFLINIAGNYTAELEVSGDFTCSKKITKPFVVQSGIQSQFSASTLGGGVPLFVNFTSLNPNAVRHSWTFGNGFTSNQANPSYNFTQKGSYTVTYQAFNANNCGTITSQLVIVGDAPTGLGGNGGNNGNGNNDFWVYPNPIKEVAQVSEGFLRKVGEIKYDLIDVHGRIIQTGEFSVDNSYIYTKDIANAVYFLRCTLKNPQNNPNLKENWVTKVVIEK